MSTVEFDVRKVARVCGSRSGPAEGIDILAKELAGLLPGLRFEHVLTRSGWHRLGGIVDGDYKRVTDNIAQWAEAESGGDAQVLLERFDGEGYFATRLQGQTHYLVAASGDEPESFVQLEVEELEEVLDRYLIDPDWMPDDLEEFIDPLEYPRVEPEVITVPRYVFRRLVRIEDLLRRQDDSNGFETLRRFMACWKKSSAGADHDFCRHWVLSLRDTPKHDDSVIVSAKPIAAAPVAPPPDLLGVEKIDSEERARRLREFDRSTGYPFAWFFHMLTSRRVPSALAEVVLQDMDSGYEYLPRRDMNCLQAWWEAPFSI